jgi:hypothetical protein
MFQRQAYKGRFVQCETPVWQPLLDLAPEHIDDFMWMCELELESGLHLHAFKHSWTRWYLHLDIEGRAFVYQEDEKYGEADPDLLLKRVLRGRRHPPCLE